MPNDDESGLKTDSDFSVKIGTEPQASEKNKEEAKMEEVKEEEAKPENVKWESYGNLICMIIQKHYKIYLESDGK